MRRQRRALRLQTKWLRTAFLSAFAAVIAVTALVLPGAYTAAGQAEAGESAQAGAYEAEHESGAFAGTVPEINTAVIRAERLPSRWYAGDYGKKPTVRRQGSDGTCWAFAAASALEAALLPGQHLVFSADHMSRKNAFTVGLDEGGDYLMAMAYLSGWQGPVTEEEDPYGDGVSPDGLEPAVHVQEIQLLEDAKPGTIKTAVKKYGAVQTSLYMKRSAERDIASMTSGTESQTDREDGEDRDPEEQASEEPGRAETVFYYNDKTKAYYCPDEELPNHDVVILGWDDEYSRFLFSETPERDGAYICQNTWENGFGDDGIFYVSYADPNIAKSCVCYTRIEPADNYSRICQYDDCGWQGRQGYADESCWFANVYTASGDGATDTEAMEANGENRGEMSAAAGEALAAVGFYAVGPDTSYEIYLVHGFRDPGDFSGREFLQKGKLANAGYYTVDLDAPQSLAAGERFAVVVNLTTPGTDDPVAVEYRADEYTQNVTTEGKESYLSQYGELWENTQERFGTNVCLKAYMKEAAE